MKILFLSIFLVSFIDAKVLVMVDTAMSSSFGLDISITKKNILLKKEEAKKVQTIAKVKIKSKIFKVYLAKRDSILVGYGVLISQKIRSKNAVILYSISKDGILKNIEIIAFNEPLEYLPSKKWKEQFRNTNARNSLKVGTDIAVISGATLSARAITNSSRVALALYEVSLKKE